MLCIASAVFAVLQWLKPVNLNYDTNSTSMSEKYRASTVLLHYLNELGCSLRISEFRVAHVPQAAQSHGHRAAEGLCSQSDLRYSLQRQINYC